MRSPVSPVGPLMVALLVFSLAIGFGCDRERSDDRADLSGGTLVFEDDFEGPQLTDDWHTGYEGWTIVDGTLQVQGARNDALWLQRPLPDEFRVQFEARSDSDEGDIKFEMLGDGETHESGYVAIFGGWNNSLNIIARLDEHGDDRKVGAQQHRVEPGTTYRMDVVRTDARLRWYVDGDLFLSYDDPDPLDGDDHRYFGFNNWESSLTFDELRIYDLSNPE